MKILVIVESPAKIKKLQSFLGSDYIVIASYGHFRDLDKKKISVDFENNFEPTYVISTSKKNVVREFKEKMKRCNMVYLASDFDREGEAIAWHIQEVLKLKPQNSKRIIFTEITKSAILQAVENPTTINQNMFYAQQARRVLDRIIGYLISPILWKQIQSSYQEKKSLSAGRVQSVIVKLVIEREEEIKSFESSNYFKITGDFKYQDSILPAELNKEKDFTCEKKVNHFLQQCMESNFYIDDVKTKKTKRQPPLPFITSSLQQDASSKLGMSPKDTMSIAQKLYEKGYITYMRTDSLVLSEEAHSNIQEQVNSLFGDEFYLKNKKTIGGTKVEKKKKKGKEEDNKNAQEAHEACRPTKFHIASITADDSISYRENRLYKLIWNRTMMSQMKPALCDITTVSIKLKKGEQVNKYFFKSKKEVITFLGYLKVLEYQKTLNQDNPSNLEGNNSESETEDFSIVEIKKGEAVSYQKIKALEKITKPPNSHYNEASLIKKLDDLGIGRPSTYATMISNVQDRSYVEKKTIEGKQKKMKLLTLENDKLDTKTEKIKQGGEKDKLFPTELGEIVNRFLLEHFESILDYQFTAHIESQLDRVAEGSLAWQEVIQETYDKIKPKLDEMNVNTTREADKYKRIIGQHPDSGWDMVTYIGKFGPLVQLKDPENQNTRFAPLGDLKMETVTLEEAVQLFSYPKTLGLYRSQDIVLHKGKYGLYLKYKGKNYSLGEEDTAEIDLKRAKEIINTKTLVSVEIRVPYQDLEVVVKEGRFGPYLVYQGKNYSIYKIYDHTNLSEEDIGKIISYQKKKPSTGSKTNNGNKTKTDNKTKTGDKTNTGNKTKTGQETTISKSATKGKKVRVKKIKKSSN